MSTPKNDLRQVIKSSEIILHQANAKWRARLTSAIQHSNDVELTFPSTTTGTSQLIMYGGSLNTSASQTVTAPWIFSNDLYLGIPSLGNQIRVGTLAPPFHAFFHSYFIFFSISISGPFVPVDLGVVNFLGAGFTVPPCVTLWFQAPLASNGMYVVLGADNITTTGFNLIAGTTNGAWTGDLGFWCTAIGL